MSFITLSLAEELASDDVGCNTFWPVTTIDTRATRYFGLGTEDDWRTPKIVSDAVLEILSRDPSACTATASTTRTCSVRRASPTSRRTTSPTATGADVGAAVRSGVRTGGVTVL